MKKIYTIISLLFISIGSIQAQGNVGIGTNTPDASAKLDISSTDKGLLIPRVSLTNASTFGLSGATSTAGMMVYNTNAAMTGGYGVGFYYWTGTWNKVATGNPIQAVLNNGQILIGDASNVPTANTMSGDATLSNAGVLDLSNGAVETSEIADNAVDGTKINLTGNANGDLMYYNGTDWVRLASGTTGQILQTNAGAAPTWSNPNDLFVFENGLTESGTNTVKLGGSLTGNTTITQGVNNMTYNLDGTGDFDIQDNGTTALFVKDDGNVGINTNNPGAKLHIIVPADNNNNPDGNGIYVYNAGNAGDNDDAIIAARVLGANGGDPFFSLDIDGVTGWSIGIDNSDADKLKFANAWNDPATNTRMSITTGGVVNIANLAGTGTRPVHANSSGDLVIHTSDVATYVLRTSVSMDNTNSGYRVAGGATGNLYVESGDIVTITITNKFWWNGGSGGDHELYGLRITGACGTINDYEGFKNGISDDVPRNQEQSLSHQFVWSATCTGNVQFSLLCDNNSQANDASSLGDIVVIATRH